MKACVCSLAFAVAAFVVSPASALDRNAFTFTKYDLAVQTEPAQQRLSARGTVTLRNTSGTPQKNAVLQISSSLTWRSIRAGDQPLQFVTQPFTSDIDHTGALSEAIVTLPKEVPNGGEVELTVGYEGVIVLDATRLTRNGFPENSAAHTDWDQIGKTATAVRGVGYVAWYPVSIDVGNLSEGSLFDVLGQWKAKVAASRMHIKLCQNAGEGQQARVMLVGASSASEQRAESNDSGCTEQTFDPIGLTVPAFVGGDYELMKTVSAVIDYFSPHKSEAQAFAQAADKVAPFASEWLGPARTPAHVIELQDQGASPFEAGATLLTPLNDTDPQLIQLAMVHELAHASFSSPRPWIAEGLAHFLQAVYRERQAGRSAALDFMGLHRTAIAEAEVAAAKTNEGSPEAHDSQESKNSLISSTADEFIRSKAAYVWWMLRDIVGDDTLKKAIAEYRAGEDTEPSYFQHLVEKEAKTNLQVFFDDWVYHDRGLPDFRVATVYPRVTVAPNYITTITIENAGAVGGEVPVTVAFAGGETTQRVRVAGHDKAVIRVETQGAPEEVVVNDGSVPESTLSNNIYKIEQSSK
jgi:aminopeptidase N